MSYPDSYNGQDIRVNGSWDSGLKSVRVTFGVSAGGDNEDLPDLASVQAIVVAAQAAIQNVAGENEVSFSTPEYDVISYDEFPVTSP